MTTPDTAEKIPTVGSAPSQEAAPPQTFTTLDSVLGAFLRARGSNNGFGMKNAFFTEFGVKKISELAPSQYQAAGEFFQKYITDKAAPQQTHHCGSDAHNWASDGDPGPGENMTLTCVNCGYVQFATPSRKFHTGGIVPGSFEAPSLGLTGENFIREHTIPAAPHVSLSEAMRAAEDRRSNNLTATMINQAIGMTLVNLGKTEITFSETEITAFAANHLVAMHQNHDYSFTVSVIPRVPE